MVSRQCIFAMELEDIQWKKLTDHLLRVNISPVNKLGCTAITFMIACNYCIGANFRGVLIFMDFMGPMQTMKNSLKISADPRKIAFWGLKPRIYLCSRSCI